ncbi:TetR/AcrR family transcriptional regulator [Paenibacillus algorifonticola]|uniref:TetR/AcrR family transcriptional regulator n=1 Tax=Paenibacillus algorifonticola TaxID=684063 RepID=UPI003D2D23E4
MNKKSHADSKKKDILQAAMLLFATKGVDGVSVKEIGQAAGVTDAAIYKHFKSKDAVALEIFEQDCASYTALIDYYVQKDGSSASRFRQLIDEVLHMHDEDQYGLLLLSQQHELFYTARMEGQLRQPLDALIDFIEQGIERGELPKQNARLSAVMVIGIITQLAVSSMHGDLPAQLAPDAEQIKLHLLALIGHS